MAEPIPFSQTYEYPEPNEAETLAKLKDTFQGISNKMYEDTGRGLRGAHAKTHAILRGELTIAGNLPPTLAQGAFAQPGQYSVIMRLSTAPGDILPDSVSSIRGLAIKIIGVTGERLPGSEGDITQDFLMVNGPTFQNKNGASFLRDAKPVALTADKMTGMKKFVSACMRGLERLIETLGGKGNKIRLLGGQLPTHPLGESYFTQVPHLFGSYFGKLSLAPVSANLKNLKRREIDLGQGDSPIRQAMSRHFEQQGGEWELRVQLCTNIDTMPIEDAATDWPQQESPYLTIGRIIAPAQQAWVEGASPAVADRLSFSPWHGLAAHRPLGSLMRMRKTIYELVSGTRHCRNGVTAQEPRNVEDIFGQQKRAA